MKILKKKNSKSKQSNFYFFFLKDILKVHKILMKIITKNFWNYKNKQKNKKVFLAKCLKKRIIKLMNSKMKSINFNYKLLNNLIKVKIMKIYSKKQKF